VAKREPSEAEANLLTATAENIGNALGHLAARLEGWKKQRADLARELQKAIQSAQSMLSEIGHEVVERPGRARRARKGRGGRPKGYVMSEETKAKLRAAGRRRKAAAKKGD
jgi:hypothetical protein